MLATSQVATVQNSQEAHFRSDDLATYEQAAALLKVRVSTLQVWVCRKEVPHIRLNSRSVRFDLNELRAWAASRRVQVVQVDPKARK